LKKILFIGGKGYLGSLIKKKIKDFKIIAPNKKYLNILNKTHLEKYIGRDLFCIINFTGQIGPNSKELNILGNKNIIQILKKKKITPRLIFFSTTLINAFKKNKFEKIKDNGLNSIYANSKIKAENFLLKNHENTTILRISNVYDNKFKKNGIFKNILNSIKNNSKLNISNIRTYRNYINIDDLIGHINSLLKNLDKIEKNKIISIVNENFNIRQIIKLFEKKYNVAINIKDYKKNLKENYSQKIFVKSFKKTGYDNKFNILKTIKDYNDKK
jgi:nucleoside-diphosphate-sugar epimerase